VRSVFSGTEKISWSERARELAELAGRQIFFVGGAPRSGTTWLQLLLDAHPDVICHGEGLFLHQLAAPLEKLTAERRRVLEGKNTTLFRHTGGYPLPTSEDTEFLTGTGILLGFLRQSGGQACRAIGEKTPENVFFFPRLRRLFPGAKFIAIARDPRDVLSSAWHLFHGRKDESEKLGFVRDALPSLGAGARVMLDFAAAHPDETALITYEGLLASTAATVSGLFRLLGVSDDPAIVAACVARSSFAAVAGRAPGEEKTDSFFRRGTAGGWEATLTEEMNALILQELGWMFPKFGWTYGNKS